MKNQFTKKQIRQNINYMKPYYIYYLDPESSKPSFESGYQAYIEKASSELDALKQWHIHLNGYYSNGNFFRNSSYYAICAL